MSKGEAEKAAAQARKDRRQAEVQSRLKTGRPAATVLPAKLRRNAGNN